MDSVILQSLERRQKSALYVHWYKVKGEVRMQSRLDASGSRGVTHLLREPISTVYPRYVLPKYRNVEELRSLIENVKEYMQTGTPTPYEIWGQELSWLEKEQQIPCGTCLDS